MPHAQVSLSIGDPTVFGNFKCPDHFHDTLNEMSRSLKYNGVTKRFVHTPRICSYIPHPSVLLPAADIYVSWP